MLTKAIDFKVFPSDPPGTHLRELVPESFNRDSAVDFVDYTELELST